MAPYSLEQNSTPERRDTNVLQMIRNILSPSGLISRLWAEEVTHESNVRSLILSARRDVTSLL